MHHHRRGLKAVTAAFALTLLVAACGGDDSSDPPETTTTTAPAAEPTTSDDTTTTGSTEPEDDGREVEEAQALAESINLTIDDFADGWAAEPPDDDDEDSAVTECFRDVDIDEIKVASADSPTFTISGNGRAQMVQTSTIVVDEEASAEALIAEIGTNQFAGCAEDALVASIEENGGQVTGSNLDPVADQGGLGDEAVGIAGAVSYLDGGDETEGQLAMYFVRTQNVVTGVQVLDIGDVAFEETLADLLAAVAERQAANI